MISLLLHESEVSPRTSVKTKMYGYSYNSLLEYFCITIHLLASCLLNPSSVTYL